MKKFLAAVAATLVLAGCAAEPVATAATTSTATVAASTTAAEVLAADQEVHTVSEVDSSKAVDITLSGTTASPSGTGVKIDGGTVTITAAGVYRISGTLTSRCPPAP